MKTSMMTAMMMAALAMAPAAADAATFSIDLDAVAYGVEGTAGNTVVTRDLGANAHITQVAYAFTLTADGESWLSDQLLRLGTSAEYFADFTPGFEMHNNGTESFSGSADLVAMGLDFFTDDDGIFRMEFIDNYNTAGTPGARWSPSSFTISYDVAAAAVPEPATWAMMGIGFGMIGGAARYRRRSMKATLA